MNQEDEQLAKAVKEIKAEGDFTPYIRQTPRTKPDIRVINLEITSCIGCPYVAEGVTDLRCGRTMEYLCKNKISEFMTYKKIHKDCPLEVKT